MIRSTIFLSAVLALAGCDLLMYSNPDDQPPDIRIRYYNTDATASPDNRTIGYLHGGALKAEGIYLVDIDGSNDRLVLTGLMTGLDWSPDGLHLAISMGGDIYMTDTSGCDPTLLASQAEMSGGGHEPSFSPDGNMIAYSINAGDDRGIWVIDLQDTTKRFVGEIAWEAPDWSPDGFQFTFAAYGRKDGKTFKAICIADTDGENFELLASSETPNIGEPAWSPDGSHIAFSMHFQIWSMKSDGSDLVQLTTEGGNMPCWLDQPDGPKIIYNNFKDGHMWIMDADGSNKRQITDQDQ
jgi:Tol biopolymer transport system component